MLTTKPYIIEGTKIVNNTQYRLEELTLPELRDQDKFLSSFTQATKEQRKQIQKSASSNTKFLETIVNEIDGSCTFKFLTEATEIQGGDKQLNPNEQKYEVDPITKEKKINNSHTYELWLKILNIIPTNESEGWIEAYNIDEEISNSQLKEIINVADLQIWENDPSFLFQGFQYNLTVLDASIYNENRKPKRWNKIHGETALLTKHWAQLLTSIDFFLPQLASSLNRKLQELGYLKFKRSHHKK